LTKLLKALLFGQENQTIAQTQYRKRRAAIEPQVFAELLRNGELAFFTDPCRGQVFKSVIMARHW
jgi:hypothetical protein